jgi:hypothetical protein
MATVLSGTISFPIDHLPLGIGLEDQERIHSNLRTVSGSIVEKKVLEMVVPPGCAYLNEPLKRQVPKKKKIQGTGKASIMSSNLQLEKMT